MAGIAVENPAGRTGRLDDIAQRVEQGKAVAMFQGARPTLLDRLGRLNVKACNIFGRIRMGFCLHGRPRLTPRNSGAPRPPSRPAADKSSDIRAPWRGR